MEVWELGLAGQSSLIESFQIESCKVLARELGGRFDGVNIKVAILWEEIVTCSNVSVSALRLGTTGPLQGFKIEWVEYSAYNWRYFPGSE